jgi:hypothetical protein
MSNVPKLVCKRNHLNEEIKEKEARMGEKNCIESGMRHWKLKTFVKIRFVSKVIMVEETLEFKQTILLSYGRQKTLTLQQRIPKAQVWAIAEVVIHCLNLVVTTCMLNQSRGD